MRGLLTMNKYIRYLYTLNPLDATEKELDDFLEYKRNFKGITPCKGNVARYRAMEASVKNYMSSQKNCQFTVTYSGISSKENMAFISLDFEAFYVSPSAELDLFKYLINMSDAFTVYPEDMFNTHIAFYIYGVWEE